VTARKKTSGGGDVPEKRDTANDARVRVLGVDRNFIVSPWAFAALFLFIALFLVEDVREDLKSGSTLFHVAWESCVILLSFFGFFGTIFKAARSFKTNLEASKANEDVLHQELSVWKADNAKFVHGLAESIDRQFVLWKLTAAERDVALLMIKGFSTKEIADLRKTAEKTVRLQVSAIFSKSGLQSRTQLLAYFIEDLLPST